MCGRLLFIAMCIFSTFSAYAQGEINNWFFGRYAGLNFNGGTPVVQTGQLNTLEGCASISDANGNLLFYTDGMRVWNRNHVIMANGSGLMGDPSSTSSSIIIPKPNSCDTFYVFTVDMQGGDAVGIGDADNASRGLRYSEIDMSANGGLGAVTTRKNISLLARTTEGLTAVRHGNGVDYWVITHGWRNGNNQRYFAYHVTPGGVNTSAVVSTAGPSLNTDEDGIGTLGYIKANKQGTRIATAHSFINNQLVITNFNNNTGVLSNAITMSVRSNGNSQGPYGVEFSPDGRYLYCTEQTSNSTYGYPIRSFIYRYDMTAGGIPGSRITFASIADQFVASLQLGPDGNIYASSAERSGNGIIYGRYLHRINNPNSPAATFTHSAIALAPGSSAYGLPTFPTGFNTMDFSVTSPITGTDVFCEKEYVNFLGTSSVYDSIRWYFGDPSSGALNTSTLLSPNHYYAATSYYEVIFIKHRCYRADTVKKTIYVRPLPVFSISDQTFCANEPVTLNPGISGDSYLWSNGSVSQTSSFGNSGTGWLTVTSNQCRYTDNFNLNSKTIPNVSAGSNLLMGCTNPNVQLNGSSTTPGVSFSWTGPGIVSDGGTATPTVDQPGTYILTVYDPVQDCSNTASVTVTQDITIPNADAGADIQLTCTTNSAVLNGTSSTPGVTYTWTGPNIVSGENTATPTVNGAGTYILTVTNPATNCSATDQLTVTQNGVVPDVNAGTDTALTCTVTSVVLNGSSANGGVIYTWSGPNIVSGRNTTSPVVNGAGTYTLTVTDPLNNCSSTDNVIVAQNNSAPDADAGIDRDLSCTVNSITLNGATSVSGATYTWSGPGIVSGDHTLTPEVNATGTYVLTVTNPANGCSATDDVDVIRNVTLPGADAGTDSELACLSTTLTLNGSSTTPGVTYSWAGPGIVSDGNTTAPTINRAGTYTLTVTNPSNGCTNTDNVVVTLNNTAPNADAGSNKELTCATTSVVLSGTSATSGVTYTWTGPNIVSGGNTATPTVNAAGAYTLTVTNPANGCTTTDNVSVSQDIAAPDAEAGNGQTLTCLVTSVVLNGSSSTSGITYSWTGPGIVSDGNTANPTINKGGTYILTVTNPANDCKTTDNVSISQDTVAPIVNAGTDKILICSAVSHILDGTSSTAGISFTWSGPGFVSGSNTLSPTVNIPGEYELTVTNLDNGCQAADKVVVTQNITPPSIEIMNDTSINCTIPSIRLNVKSSVSNSAYSWSGPGITQGSNTSSPTIHSGGSYSVTVKNPANDCFTNAMVNVTADQTLPDLIADDFKHIPCLEETTFISGSSSTPEVSYQWTGPGIVSGTNSNQAVVSKGGLYILTVTGKNGCHTSDTVDVFRDVPFTFIADITPTACPEIATGSIEININGGQAPFSYSWSDGSATLFLKELYSDEYMLTVTDALGCEIDSLFFVPEDKFYATAYQNAVVDLGDSLQLFVESNISTDDIIYSWSPATYLSCTDCEMPFTTPLGDVTYTLFATDTNGCTSSSSVEITLRNTFDLHFPNAFTPNGDGLNEIFRALGDTDKIHSYYMSVYNRWNEKIFETRDILQGWTGKQKGDFDYTEAFIYYVSTTFITGESKEYKGSVVVLK